MPDWLQRTKAKLSPHGRGAPGPAVAAPTAWTWLPHSGTARVLAPPGPSNSWRACLFSLAASKRCCSSSSCLTHGPGWPGPAHTPPGAPGIPRPAVPGPARSGPRTLPGESRPVGGPGPPVPLPLLSLPPPAPPGRGARGRHPRRAPLPRPGPAPRPRPCEGWGGRCRGGRRGLPGRALTVHGLLLEERGHGGTRTPAAASAGCSRLLLR